MDLLNSVDAALRHQVNQFDFPERLDFSDNFDDLGESSLPRTPPTPVLAHTSNNASVRAHEQALSDLLSNIDVVANDLDDDVRMRQLHLVERIRRELGELDRKVLEVWAARRRYSPAHMDEDM
jgi:hypothetical protein